MIDKDANTAKLLEENKKKTDELIQQRKRLNEKVNRLMKQKRKITEKEKREIVEDLLKDIFTPAQIKCFLRKDWDRCYDWEDEDYVNALTLKLISKKAYIYLRDKKLLPLPGLTTLREYFYKFDINEGYFEKVHELLEIMANKLTDKERIIRLGMYLKKPSIVTFFGHKCFKSEF